jgi:hypothetical protein
VPLAGDRSSLTIRGRAGGPSRVSGRSSAGSTLFEAAIRDDDLSLAPAIASERLAVRPSSTYTRCQVDRIGVLA